MLTDGTAIASQLTYTVACPRQMALHSRANCNGSYFRLNAPPSGLRQEALSGHLNEQDEVPGSVHLHRRPLGPNPTRSNRARAGSTVPS